MFFAYSAPLPQIPVASVEAINSLPHAAPLLAMCVAMAFAIIAAFKPASHGFVWCPAAQRWRHPVSGRFVPAPL